MSLLERSDVVRSVSSHEGSVAEVLERGKNELLLRRRDSSVHPGVLDEIEPGREVFVLLESDSGDADVVVGEDLLIEGSGRVDGDDDGLVDRSPNEICKSKTKESRRVSEPQRDWRILSKKTRTHRFPRCDLHADPR